MARKQRSEPVEYAYIPLFQIPIYGGKVLLCRTREEWASIALMYEGEPDTENCKGLSIRYLNGEGRTYVIGIFDGAVDTFVHELDHATFHILGDVGVPVEDGGAANEAHAYLLGHLFKEIFPVFQNSEKAS
jgi:hypothetical protein